MGKAIIRVLLVSIISMRLVVGLGNPGEKYFMTRHNVGYMVVDKMVGGEFKREEKMKAMVCREDEVVWIKPETYMNRSGESVQRVASFYKIESEDIYVIHDDLDIRLGEYKIQKGRGPKDHNGLNNITLMLGSDEYWRVRVGVDNREDRRISGEEYVLNRFMKDEVVIIEEVIGKVTNELVERLELTR